MPDTQPRDSDGKYLTDKMDRPCRCGHTLGAHTGARAKVEGRWLQECLADGCECECFKKLPPRKPL